MATATVTITSLVPLVLRAPLELRVRLAPMATAMVTTTSLEPLARQVLQVPQGLRVPMATAMVTEKAVATLPKQLRATETGMVTLARSRSAIYLPATPPMVRPLLLA